MRCVVCKCEQTRRSDSQSFSLFRFPKAWRMERSWVSIIRKRVGCSVNPKFDRVCERHFNKDDIDWSQSRPKLSSTAVPVIAKEFEKPNETMKLITLDIVKEEYTIHPAFIDHSYHSNQNITNNIINNETTLQKAPKSYNEMAVPTESIREESFDVNSCNESLYLPVNPVVVFPNTLSQTSYGLSPTAIISENRDESVRFNSLSGLNMFSVAQIADYSSPVVLPFSNRQNLLTSLEMTDHREQYKIPESSPSNEGLPAPSNVSLPAPYNEGLPAPQKAKLKRHLTVLKGFVKRQQKELKKRRLKRKNRRDIPSCSFPEGPPYLGSLECKLEENENTTAPYIMLESSPTIQYLPALQPEKFQHFIMLKEDVKRLQNEKKTLQQKVGRLQKKIRKDNEYFEKMCRKCLYTIREMYALIDKCEKSNHILTQMKDSSVQVRKLSDNFLDRINVKRPRPEEEEDIELNEVVPPKRVKDETAQSENVDEDEFIEVAIISEDASESSQDATNTAPSIQKSIEDSLTSAADDLADIIDFDDTTENTPNSSQSKTKSAENKAIASENKTNSTTAVKSNTDPKENAQSDQQSQMKKCNLCRKSFTKEFYEKHAAKHIENPREFFKDVTNERKKCPKCPLSYKRISMLGDHMKAIHGISTMPGCGPIPCDVCSQPCASLELLVEHRNLHPESEQFQCRICSKEGIKTGDFVKHVKFHLESESASNYKCYQCNETFSDMATMMVHEKVIHTKRTHACEFCNNKYTTRVGLQNHVMTKHGSNKLVSCSICGLHLTRREELAGHMEGFKERLKCDECPLKFSNQKDVDAHKLYHRGGKNSCDDCQLAFHATFILQRHMEMHSMLPFQCQHCKRYLRTEASYKHHLAQHQENDGTKTDSNSQKPISSIDLNTQVSSKTIPQIQASTIQSNQTKPANEPSIKKATTNSQYEIISPTNTRQIRSIPTNKQSIIQIAPSSTKVRAQSDIPTTGIQTTKSSAPTSELRKILDATSKSSTDPSKKDSSNNNTGSLGNNIVISNVISTAITNAFMGTQSNAPTTGKQNSMVTKPHQAPRRVASIMESSDPSRKDSTANTTANLGSRLVISDVRSVPNSEPSPEQPKPNISETSLLIAGKANNEIVEDTKPNVSILQNLQNISANSQPLIVDNFIIREINEGSSADVRNNSELNVVGGNAVLNNPVVHMPVGSNAVLPNNLLPSEPMKPPGLYYNNINVNPEVPQQGFLISNVQGYAVPGGMLVFPPTLSAVDYLCNQTSGQVPVMTGASSIQDNRVFTTIPTGSINPNVRASSQIAKKSTTSLPTAVMPVQNNSGSVDDSNATSSNSSSNKARISVRRDLMK